MTKRRSERSRWVQIFLLAEPAANNADSYAKHEFAKLAAIVQAFEKVGRVVRVERLDHNALVFRARKA